MEGENSPRKTKLLLHIFNQIYYNAVILWSRENLISLVTRKWTWRRENRLGIPTVARGLSLLYNFQISSGAHPARWSFPVVKGLGHETEHSPKYNTEVKNMWRHTAILVYLFKALVLIKAQESFYLFTHLQFLYGPFWESWQPASNSSVLFCSQSLSINIFFVSVSASIRGLQIISSDCNIKTQLPQYLSLTHNLHSVDFHNTASSICHLSITHIRSLDFHNTASSICHSSIIHVGFVDFHCLTVISGDLRSVSLLHRQTAQKELQIYCF
jgi:hypothetical protein